MLIDTIMLAAAAAAPSFDAYVEGGCWGISVTVY